MNVVVYGFSGRWRPRSRLFVKAVLGSTSFQRSQDSIRFLQLTSPHRSFPFSFLAENHVSLIAALTLLGSRRVDTLGIRLMTSQRRRGRR